MKDFIEDVLQLLFIISVCALIGAIVIILKVKFDEKQAKTECYEIYATDNVILKKCEKYFEKENNND